MDVYENSVYPQCGHFIGKIVINNGISSFSSPNSVATLRVLTVRVKAVFNRGVLIRVRHFSCKVPYKIALLKCQCAFRLRRLAQNDVLGIGIRHFSCKLPKCQCAFRLRRLAQNAVPGGVSGHFSIFFL